jgi:hypothetical protein
MSELDHLREEVAYLKFWLGIVVVMGLILLSTGIVVLHRRIERRIVRIKEF